MASWFWAYLTRERSARLITGDADEMREAVEFIQAARSKPKKADKAKG